MSAEQQKLQIENIHPLRTRWTRNLMTVLIKDEDSTGFLYWDKTGERIVSSDQLGHPSIGVGRNLNAQPLDTEEIEFLLERDIRRKTQEAKNIFGAKFNTWSDARQHGIVSLVFNLGEAKLRTFNQTVPAILAENWETVEYLLHQTKWARDVDPKQRPNVGRDDRIIKMVCREEYDPFYGIL